MSCVSGISNPDAPYSIERYRVSAQDDLSHAVQSQERGEMITVRAALPVPAIELVVVRRMARAH